MLYRGRDDARRPRMRPPLLDDLPLRSASPEPRYYVDHHNNPATGLDHEDEDYQSHVIEHLLAERGISSGCYEQPSDSRAFGTRGRETGSAPVFPLYTKQPPQVS